ncbi:MAG: glycosyltransferase [Flavobacterium sp.]|nr:MAG: glycosyltransferase [Flavobacterium sp.]
MKVLLFDTTQSYLSPGGKQVHAQKLFENLPKVGVEVEYARWWDPNQSFDIVHFFGYNAPYLINSIKKKNKKTVLTQIMDAQTNFSPMKKKVYGWGAKMINALPSRVRSKFNMSYLNEYDALVYMHKFDKKTAIEIFHVDSNKTAVIPHASDSVEIGKVDPLPDGLPKKYLVSAGSIVERKRPVLLAQMAKKAKVPVVFIGSGHESDSYFQEFKTLVDNKYVFYLGFVSQETKISVLLQGSGFVLLSTAESGCIAVYEAASLGLPLLLPDLLWAQCYADPKEIHFCSCKNFHVSVQQLHSFYSIAERRAYPSFRVHTWEEIAYKYKEVYESIL